MRISWTIEALADLDNVLAAAADRNQLEAHNIRLRVERSLRAIATFPKGALYNQGKDYFEKHVPRTRVILVYRLEAQRVVIFAVFHTSRDPQTKP